METIERRRELIGGTIATLFSEWENQSRKTVEEHDLLKAEIKTLRLSVSIKQDAIAQLKNEVDGLRKELSQSQGTSQLDESLKVRVLNDKYNNLRTEHDLLKATAAANQHDLIKQLRRERDKLRGWNHFSSPGPPPAQSRLAARSEAGQNHHEQDQGLKPRECLPGGRENSDGLSFTRERSSHPQNSPIIAVTDRLRNEEFDCDVDASRDKAGAKRETRPSDQPQNATEKEALVIEADFLQEQRIASPELPSMTGTYQSPPAGCKSLPTAVGKAVSHESLPQIQNSDMTAPPSEGPITAEMEVASVDNTPSSDLPEFLQARTIKKKSATEVLAGANVAAGSPSEPINIKSDPDNDFISSKPSQLIGLASSVHDSLDLDPSTSMPEQRSPRKKWPPLLLPSISHEEARWKSGNKLQSHTTRRVRHEPRSVNGLESGPAQQSSSRRRDPSTAEPAAPLRQIDANAQIKWKNVEQSSGTRSRKRKADDCRGVEAIPTISEDGEEFGTKSRKLYTEGRNTPRSTNSPVHQRLSNLMTENSAQKTPLIPLSAKDIDEMKDSLWAASLCYRIDSRKPFLALMRSEDNDWEWWDKARDLLDLEHKTTPNIPFWHPANVQRRRATKTQQTSTPKSAPAMKSRSKAITTPSHPSGPNPSAPTDYRCLPLSSLDLTHFKLNPSANHNLNHAYTDVVRNQTERKCLPGCTRPECCGAKFTLLAQTLPQPNNNNNNVNQQSTSIPTSPSSLTPHDHTLLESHLGSYQYAHLLDTSPASLLPHLLPARTTHLANKYGKAHRALHQRAPSPPGFWNVDFPGTQEREENGRVAAQREREEVQRRWREALKNKDPRLRREKEEEEEMEFGRGRERTGGEVVAKGLWMFADE